MLISTHLILTVRSGMQVIYSVLAGSGEILAHRDQLRPYRAREEARTNILIPTASGANMNLEQPATLRASGSADEDGDFRGYSNAELARARKRKVDAAQLPEVCLRRSKRLRKPKQDFEFKYV
ncbi:uncharacterized protein LOC119771173 isoform X1 [Culex quinquefasciatus]|uniref:uncharacterized protein LOC119771173 isoform X1 n=1 Tax=Culex quinquefasciatus TaxID=7176 RepID=UPI0018E2E14D|nr:uncharacterized protein LOC119771173 isoform X1 [Culex quinquefasciatus]